MAVGPTILRLDSRGGHREVPPPYPPANRVAPLYHRRGRASKETMAGHLFIASLHDRLIIVGG
jgi:hypothetical protein